MTRSPKVLVVGDGIIGRAIAFELAQRGAAVTTVDRQRDGSAWRASAGKLTPSSEAEHLDAALLASMRSALQLWPDFLARLRQASDHPVSLQRTGALFVALQGDHRGEWQRLTALHQRLGIEVHAIDAAAMRALEPALSSRQLGGLLAPHEGSVEPAAVALAIDVALERSKAQRIQRSEVAHLDLDAQRPSLRLSADSGGSRMEFDAAVLATGAWAREDDATIADLRPVKGQFAVLEGPPLLRHVLHTPDVYLVPRPGGRIYVGASVEEVGFEPGCTPREIMRLFHEAWRALPEIQELKIVQTGFGFRPALRDHAPVHRKIGARSVLATGHFRHGVLLAPHSAALVADHLLLGRALEDQPPAPKAAREGFA